MSETRDDDLRSLIAETLAGQRPAGEAAPETPGAASEAETAPPPADEHQPRERSEPTSRPGVPSTVGLGPASGGEAAPAEAPAPPPAAAEPALRQAQDRGGPPEHWSAADRQAFEALPEAAHEPFLALYRRMESGFTPKLQRGAALEKDYGVLDRIFTPEQRQLLAQQGREPKDIIGVWHGVEVGLQNRQTQGEVVARIIHGYNVSLADVGQWLNRLHGFAPQPTGYANPEPPPAPAGNGNGNLDEQTQRRLAALEGEMQARHYAAAGDVVGKFANATDAKGNLLHPYFAEVEPLMQQYAAIDRSSGKAFDMEDLYNRAVWSNAPTRARVLADERAAEAARTEEERRTRAEAARRAGSSITGAPSPGQMPSEPVNPDRSIGDEIRAHMPRRMP